MIHDSENRPANSQDFTVRLKVFLVGCSNVYTYKFTFY